MSLWLHISRIKIDILEIRCNIITLCNLFWASLLKKIISVFLLQGCEDGISLIADNPFVSKKTLIPFEKGIRIDYILFKVVESFLSSHLLKFYPFMFTARGNLLSVLTSEAHFPFLISRVLPKRTFTVISCPPLKAPSPTIHSHTPTMKL